MRFRYPLQKVVDLKGSEKSMAEWEYAAALGKLRTEELRLEQLYREREQVENELVLAHSGPVPLIELIRVQNYLDWLAERIEDQLEDVDQATAESNESRGRLKDRMIDEKVWLNARDKAYQGFRSVRLAREQNELDEIATNRASMAKA